MLGDTVQPDRRRGDAVLVGIFAATRGGAPTGDAIREIGLLLVAPLIAGQLLRPWIGDFVLRQKAILSATDRGSILLVVYGAFGHAVSAGLWRALPISGFAIMIVIEAMVLAFMLFATYFAAKAFGFNREDTIAIVFCGSKKSLAAGVPMAGLLFAGPDLGMILLPTMLFHQMQLMVCAVLARRWAQEGKAEAEAPPAGRRAAAWGHGARGLRAPPPRRRLAGHRETAVAPALPLRARSAPRTRQVWRSQFSRRRPSIRLNSNSLSVTMTQPTATA